MRFDLAVKRFGLAKAEMTLAKKPRVPPSRRAASWTEATRLLELAQPVFVDEQKRGGLIGNMKDSLRELHQALAECQASLSRGTLRSRPPSPPLAQAE